MKIIDQKGGEKVFKKGKCIKIPLLKTKMAIYSIKKGKCIKIHLLKTKMDNAATVKFRKFGIEPVASLG